MKVKLVVTAFVLLVVCASSARAQTSPSIPIGTGHTLDKPQSKLWYTVDSPGVATWWAILSDGVDLYFHKLVGGVLRKQTFPHAVVDVDNTARADVLWNGTDLFVLLCKGTTSGGSEKCNSPLSLSKYGYDPVTQIYTLAPGFPVLINILSGSESSTIAQDSTGRLWIAYDPGTAIRVLWSDSHDHTIWETSGGGLAVNVKAVHTDDLAAVVAFPDRVGVLWSNQEKESFHIAVHLDGQPATTWEREELVAQGDDIADDHLNLAVTDTGDLLAATKSSSTHPLDTTNLFVRWNSGIWDGPYFVAADSSRPHVVFDRTNQDVYVFYTGSFASDRSTISYKVANLSRLTDLATSPEIVLISVHGQDINNVTTTKQAVDGITGLLVVAKDELKTSASRAYYELVGIASGSGNTPPVAANDGAVTAEDVPVTISVLTNDTDADGDSLSVASVTPPAQGTASVNPDHTVTYAPRADFNGADSFTYTASDGRGGLSTATVFVTVTPVNDPPVAANDGAVTAEDVPVTINVLTNDTDADGDSLSVASVTPPAQGTAAVNPDHTVTYAPRADFNGADSFTYTASDGRGGLSTATVFVTVTPVNDPPVAANDGAVTAEDVPVTISVLTNDTDADGDGLSVASVTTPAHGTAAVNPDQTVTYAPRANFNGADSFTYTASDGRGGFSTATVFVTVTPVNDPPVAANDGAVTAEDVPVTIRVLTNDTDADGDGLSVASVTTPAHGTAAVNPDHTVTYAPRANFNGADSFTYTASDGRGGFSTATVFVTVTPVNDPPVANNQAVSTPGGTSVATTLGASDPDGDALSFTVITPPGNGMLSGTPPNLTYTPNPGFVGSDAFTFQANDGFASSNLATVSLTVTEPAADGGFPSPSADFQSPSATAPVTSNAGDNNGFETGSANAGADDGLFAVDAYSGTSDSGSCTSGRKDKHLFYNYNLSIPGGTTIKGIEVRLDAMVDSTSGSPKLCVELSWDGGATWTAPKSTPTLTTSEATYVLGDAADLWGRTWAVGDVSNTSLRVRVTSVASTTRRDFSLDWVAVRLTYQP